MSVNNSGAFLFSQYFLEIQKFFSKIEAFTERPLNTINQNTNPNPITSNPPRIVRSIPGASKPSMPGASTNTPIMIPDKLKVFYGVPSAAYKRIMTMINGVPDLPIMNFWCADSRQYIGNNPFARTYNKKDIDTSGPTWTIEKHWAPQHWELTYQCSLWTSSYAQRDDLIMKILLLFQGKETAIRYYDDPNDPKRFLWMPLRIEDTFQDETELEGQQEKETRDVIRTSFTLIGKAILPYASEKVPVIKKIQADLNIENDTLYDPSFFIHNITNSLPTDNPIIIENVDYRMPKT